MSDTMIARGPVGEVERARAIVQFTVGDPRPEFDWLVRVEPCSCGRGCADALVLSVRLSGGVEIALDDSGTDLFIPRLPEGPKFQGDDLTRITDVARVLFGESSATALIRTLPYFTRGTPDEEVVASWLRGRGN